jgi:hypothetical protein
MSALAFDGMVVFAGEVAAVDPLDLDDAGPEVRQMAGGQRRGHRLLDRNDRDSLERPHQLMLGAGLQMTGEELHDRGSEPHLPRDARDLVPLIGKEQQLGLDATFPGRRHSLP